MELPQIGIGTAHIKDSEMELVLRTALTTANILHVDCAKVYGNEESVGKALKNIFDSGDMKRDDVFITSKVWNDDHAHVEEACRASLRRLEVACLDLYLIHWPLAWKKGTVFCPDNSVTIESTWRAMESLVDKGLTRYIGVSNFDETNLKRILRSCRIKPYANQIEIHPRLSQPRLVDFNKQNGIRVIAWSPLGKCKYLESKPALVSLAKTKNRTIAQIVLRWHFQRGICSIPRSSKTARIVSNASIFDFELSEDEMHQIDALNEHKRLTRDWIGVFDTTPYFPYKFPIGFMVAWLFRAIFFIVPNKVDLQGNPFAK